MTFQSKKINYFKTGKPQQMYSIILLIIGLVILYKVVIPQDIEDYKNKTNKRHKRNWNARNKYTKTPRQRPRNYKKKKGKGLRRNNGKTL